MAKTKTVKYQAIENILNMERKRHERNISDNVYSRSQEYATKQVLSLDSTVIRGNKSQTLPCQDDLVVEETKNSTFIGLFDGHGSYGHQVSKLCSFYLQKKSHYFKKETIKLLKKNPSEGLSRLLLELEDKLAPTIGNDTIKYSGSTATLIHFSKDILTVNWLGDSKCCIFVSSEDDLSDLTPIEVTRDHDLTSPEEKERITENGGVIQTDKHGILRLSCSSDSAASGLAMSKCLGDTYVKSLGATCESDTKSLQLKKGETTFGDLGIQVDSDRLVKHAFVVVGSDGLWDVMSFSEITEHLKPTQISTEFKQNISYSLCTECRQKATLDNQKSGYIDDISAVCSKLF